MPDDLARVDPKEYDVGEELAHGGMGRILDARDRRLDRRVAIKEMVTFDEESLIRFQREVYITARLQHPAIVPVYEGGVWPDGRLFYAMKMVSGRALDKAVAATGDLDERLALVPNVIAVAEALAYAHDQRIIHRDLKPANVLVGEYGETVVIDWGLAKDLAAAEEMESGRRQAGGPEATQAGNALGTPAYMSPEQARGDPADERSDVYGLGALLYHVLYGKPPYHGESAADVIDKVVMEGPVPLAQRVPGVPRELATIVDRAMARRPDDRYPSAKEMAADLRRFQTGQLVGAHEYSRWDLFRRWVDRNRVTVQVAAVLLAALVVVVGLALRRIFDERDRAESARRYAELGRAAAEELVDYTITDLHARLAPLGKLDLIEGIGNKVETYYRKLGADDVPAKIRRSQAIDLIGDIKVNRGDLDGALLDYNHGLEIRTAAGHEIALSDAKLGEVYRAKGNLDAGSKYYRLAEAGFASDLADSPSDAGALRLARARQAIGDVAYARGDLEGALAGFRGACELRHQVATRDPAVAIDEAACQTEIGDVLIDRGDLDGALLVFQQVVALCAAAAGHTDDALKLETCEAIGQERIGEVHLRHGDPAAAVAPFQRELELRTEVYDNDPSNARNERDLSVAWQNVANADAGQAHLAEALAAYEKSRDIAERLAHKDSANADWQRDHAIAIYQVGVIQMKLKKTDEALASYRKAIAITLGLNARDPKNTDWLRDSAVLYHKIGTAEMRLQHDDAAEDAMQRALVIERKLAELHPDVARWQKDLADSLSSLSDAQEQRKHLDAALVSCREQQAILEKLVARDPGARQNQVDLAQAISWEGEILAEQRKLAEARACHDRAVVMTNALLADGHLDADQAAILKDILTTKIK